MTDDPTQIEYDAARTIVDAVHAKARELGYAAVAAVMDQSGNLKAFGAMDNVPTVSITLAQAKCAGSALIGLDGLQIATIYERRPLNYEALNRILPLPLYPGPGALPLRSRGRVIGAVGVSGCPTPEDDHLCAEAGAAALNAAQGSSE